MALAYMKLGAPFFNLTNVANRRKIITAAGKPVNPGAAMAPMLPDHQLIF